jgi:hypothetical protein
MLRFERRFWGKVRIGDGCWEWTRFINPWGYGQAWNGKRIEGAHRIAWRLVNGEIPDGLLVCHRCDNPKCVRPGHLFLGTDADNYNDMARKGRRGAARGEQCPTRKLSNDGVREIRRLAAAKQSVSSIARAFGVSRTVVQGVVARRCWAHVE